MIKYLVPTFFSIIFFFVAITSPVFGQKKTADTDTTNIWNFGGTGTVNFSQISLSNWAAGGQNSVSVLGVASVFGNYTEGKNSWDNNLDVTYGTVKLEDQRLRKSDDKLEFNTKYGRRASSDWFYSAQLNLKTQLTPTYTASRDTVLSDFLAPAFILTSLGMDYKPSNRFSVFVSPITGKFTYVRLQQLADRGSFGVRGARRDAVGELILGTGDRLRREFGGFVNIRYREEIMKNVVLQSKLDLFSNYLNNPENVDLNWENLINFKVNKLIAASLFVHMIYDDDILIKVPAKEVGGATKRGPRLQVKQTLGLGLSYSFQ